MAYKVFQNGFQLPASDLNNYLMNQSVISFADASARSAAITSPVEGMLTYLESTNSYEGWNGSAWTDINDNTGAIAKSLLTTAGDTIYATGASTPARLALGSTGSIIKSNGSAPTWLAPGLNGQILTSTGSDLSWVSPGAGGSKNWVLAGTVALTGATTLTISGLGGPENLAIFLEGASTTVATGSQMILRFNADTTNYSNTYNYYTFETSYLMNNNNSNGGVGASGVYLGQTSLNAASSVSGHLVLSGGSQSGAKVYQYVGGGTPQSSSQARHQIGGGFYTSSSTITSVSITSDNGNFDAGTLRIYKA